MARAPRRIIPGRVYHLIARLVDRRWYIKSEEERDCYRSMLGRALAKSDWICLAYALMSNHIHLCVVAGEQRLDTWVRPVHSPFAGWLNDSYDRIGCIFTRGPKAIDVPDHRIGVVIAYIHNNPVRAKVVAAAADSTWTSHRAYLGLEHPPKWLHVREGQARMGIADPAAFDRWVASEPDADEIDAACSDDETDSREERLPIVRPDPSEVVSATAAELGMRIEQVCSRRKAVEEQLAREVAVRCAASLGVSGAKIAAALHMSQQGVSVIHRRRTTAEVAAIRDRVLRRLVR